MAVQAFRDWGVGFRSRVSGASHGEANGKSSGNWNPKP